MFSLHIIEQIFHHVFDGMTYLRGSTTKWCLRQDEPTEVENFCSALSYIAILRYKPVGSDRRRHAP